MSSPTARTLAELRKRGYQLVQVVERWNSFAKIRVDLFGIIDVLAVRVDMGMIEPLSHTISDSHRKTLAVQCTSGDHVAERVTKITDSPAFDVLRLAGWSVSVWGWRKNSKGRYVLREVDLA